MYSPRITAKMLEKVEQNLKLRLHRYTPTQSHEVLAGLNTLLKEDGSLKRPLRTEERAFIRNETILFQLDFNYACRYFTIIKDGVEGGGIGFLKLWESQKILMDLISRLEEQNIDFYERGYPCDGILICDNKGGRQLGHTMLARAICMHRVLSWPYTRGMGASVDDDKIQELYDRDKLILDNLPFFLKPTLEFDKKAEHLSFELLGSKMLYQAAKQQSGLGTGRQFDVNHNTEVSSWPYPRMLEIDFFPTLPQHPYTFSLQETTPLGRKNWWFQWSEKVRHGRIPRWAYLYIPFYAEPKKYRRQPPDSWSPSEQTLAMARQVYETSPEFTGKNVTLDRQQMYWWEASYDEALENNSLNLFLSNYSITPEQSFQHQTTAALSVSTIDWMRSTTTKGLAFEIESFS